VQATAEAAGTHLTPRLLPPASQYRMSTARHCHTPAGVATDVDGKVAAWRSARRARARGYDGLPRFIAREIDVCVFDSTRLAVSCKKPIKQNVK